MRVRSWEPFFFLSSATAFLLCYCAKLTLIADLFKTNLMAGRPRLMIVDGIWALKIATYNVNGVNGRLGNLNQSRHACVTGAPSRVALVVEDDYVVRSDILAQFQAQGWSVLDAATGEAALALLTDHRIDVVFTDIQLPGAISGWDDIAGYCKIAISFQPDGISIRRSF